MKHKIFFISLFSFVLGVILRSFFELPHVLISITILVGVIFLAVFFIQNKKIWNLLIVGVAILALGLGMFRYEIKDQKSITNVLKEVINQKVVMRGIVSDEPDERENNTRIIFSVDEILMDGEWHDADKDKILIYTPRYPKFSYGDVIKISGKLQQPKNFSFSTDSGHAKTFDWVGYLAKDDIFLQMFYPDIESVSHDGGSALKRKLFALKDNFVNTISGVISEPHASFMSGLLIGAKKGMPEDLQEDFRRVGIIHLVVLSGYNITIIAENIGRAVRLLPIPYFLSSVLSVLGIILFAILTGASATIVRASIMAILVLFARSTGRIYEVTYALFIAGFFMIVHNPKIVRFDASFQLSFLATLGLIYIAPKIEGYLQFLPKRFGFRGHASATISAQLAVTPLILHLMGNLSLVALPANLLILVFVPVTMLFGFLTWLAGSLNYILSLPFAWISWALLEYELSVVEIFSSFQFASVEVPYFPAAFSALIYGLFAYLIFLRKKYPKTKTLADEFEIEEI